MSPLAYGRISKATKQVAVRCAWCGAWRSLLDASRHLLEGAPVSHGICETCTEKALNEKTPAPDGRPVGGSETLPGNDLPSHRTSISEDEAA